jgi:diguanylate cyclase (GGDEF)-like protein
MLTNLNNRYYFEQELSRLVDLAKRGKHSFAMLYIDLDQFKTVNDTAGHTVGDTLLIEVARSFTARLRRGDILARLGGDEFGVLLQDITRHELEEIAASYQDALHNLTFDWKDKIFHVHSSIGIALIDSNSLDAAEILRQADVACYVAKTTGRNRTHFYKKDEDTQIQHIGELDIINKLNHALSNDGFKLLYQPITRSDGSNLDYYEALLRLPDGNKMLPPSIFIPIAERNSLMTRIDEWVINQIMQLIEKDQYPGYTFSINLSGSSINNNKIFSLLSSKLKNNRGIAESMIIEITETSAVTHIEKAGDFMRDLRRYGVRFALDDFGTGFSSFAYLKHLPADLIKIDGVFVKDIAHDPADLAMVRSINHIAHSLDKKTIAEYVENEQIRIILEDIGVDYLQGYHMGKPAELEVREKIRFN